MRIDAIQRKYNGWNNINSPYSSFYRVCKNIISLTKKCSAHKKMPFYNFSAGFSRSNLTLLDKISSMGKLEKRAKNDGNNNINGNKNISGNISMSGLHQNQTIPIIIWDYAALKPNDDCSLFSVKAFSDSLGIKFSMTMPKIIPRPFYTKIWRVLNVLKNCRGAVAQPVEPPKSSVWRNSTEVGSNPYRDHHFSYY